MKRGVALPSVLYWFDGQYLRISYPVNPKMIFYHDILSFLRKGHVLVLTKTYDKSDAKTTKKKDVQNLYYK